MTTVERIKQLAIEQGRSLTYLCRQLGFASRSYFNDIEKNHREIPQDKLEILAEIFDVTVDYLLGKEDKKIPLGPIIEREEDELWVKITALDATDRIKADAFISGLLAADKYGTTIPATHQIKIAARGGGVKEITVTDSQLEALKALPDVTDLGDADN